MALEQIDVLGQWHLDAEGIPQPRLLLDHPGGSYVNITATPVSELINDPNSVVGRYEAESVIIAQIAADPNYTIQEGTTRAAGAPPDPTLGEIPTQSEYAQYRTEVLGMVNPENGQPLWTAGQYNQIVGETVETEEFPDGRTWGQINQDILDGLAATTKKDAPIELNLSLSDGETTLTYRGSSITPSIPTGEG